MRTAISQGILQWAMSIRERRKLKDLRFPPYRMKWKKDAIRRAIRNGDLEIVTWLLDIGCDVNVAADDQSDLGLKRLPVVLYALTMGKYGIVDLLIQRGALVYGKTICAERVQELRCQGYEPADISYHIFIERFVEHARSANVSVTYAWTMQCIWGNKFSLIRQLQALDIRFPERYMFDGYCALEQALTKGLVDESVHDIWEYLVREVVAQDQWYLGPDGSIGHGHGHFARACQTSELAVESGNVAALRTLLGYKCFIEAVQTEPFTWHRAFETRSTHPEMIPILIEHSAFAEGTLAGALQEKEYELAETLLSRGVDPHTVTTFYTKAKVFEEWNKTFMKLLDYAERMQDNTMISLLQRFGAERGTSTMEASRPPAG